METLSAIASRVGYGVLGVFEDGVRPKLRMAGSTNLDGSSVSAGVGREAGFGRTIEDGTKRKAAVDGGARAWIGGMDAGKVGTGGSGRLSNCMVTLLLLGFEGSSTATTSRSAISGPLTT